MQKQYLIKKLKRFIIIRPFTKLRGKIYSFHPPLNLAILAAFIEKEGFETRIFDYESEYYDKNILLNRIKSYSPVAVGLTAYTNTINNAHVIAGDIKRDFPELPLILGGPHSTAIPCETLEEFPFFDIVVIGEGEATLLCLLNSFLDNTPIQNVKGIAYRKNGGIILGHARELISDLDTIPFPKREMLITSNSDRHFSRGILMGNKYIASMYTSRGCAFNCIFCAVKSSYSGDLKRVRFRSVENVNEEIALCAKKYDYRHICFQDDSFTLNKSRFFPIADKLKELHLTWNCDVRANTIDRDTLLYMKKCGCVKVSIGVESGSQKILDLIKKKITVAQVKNAFRLCHEVGIKIKEGTFIIGSHPDETIEDIEKSMALIREIKPDFVSLAIGVPYPGTELRRIMQERNLIESNEWQRYSLSDIPVWHTEYFSAEQLLKLQKKLVRYVYLTPQYFLKSINNPKLLLHLVRAGFQFFFLRPKA